MIASGIGGFPAIVEAVRTTDWRGIRRLSPFTVPSFLVNLAAGHISIHYGYKGPLGAPVTACAAGVQAIGDAMRLIRGGEADIAICGGAEACIDLVSLGGFAAAVRFRPVSTMRRRAHLARLTATVTALSWAKARVFLWSKNCSMLWPEGPRRSPR